MEKKKDAITAIIPIVGSKVTAELVIERLYEAGYLQLGYGNKDVDNIVSTFQETFRTTKTSRADRYAADRLAKLHGAQAVSSLIKLYATMNNDEYAPVISNVKQLEDKWINVVSFIRKKAQKQQDEEVIQV